MPGVVFAYFYFFSYIYLCFSFDYISTISQVNIVNQNNCKCNCHAYLQKRVDDLRLFYTTVAAYVCCQSQKGRGAVKGCRSHSWF